MVSPVLFIGGEDIDFQPLNYNYGSGYITAGNATAAGFRSGYARHSLSLQTNTGLNVPAGATNAGPFLRSVPAWSSSAFWFTGRVTNNGGQNTSGSYGLRFVDSSGVVRLRMVNNATGANNQQWYKVDAAGAATQLGSTMSTSLSVSTAVPDKIDLYVNYAVAGTLTMYVNGTQVYSFTGDLTTNSATALAQVDLGMTSYNGNGNSSNVIYWSQVMVSTLDTRSLDPVTRAATANGNTHNFDGGTAANLAATSQNTGDASPNYSGTAGQINEYTVTPALPTGTFGVVSVVHKVRAIAGTSGPQKLDGLVRTGGTDYASVDIPLLGSWQTYMVAPWDLNPNTGLAWAVGDLVNASTAYNMGLKSVT